MISEIHNVDKKNIFINTECTIAMFFKNFLHCKYIPKVINSSLKFKKLFLRAEVYTSRNGGWPKVVSIMTVLWVNYFFIWLVLYLAGIVLTKTYYLHSSFKFHFQIAFIISFFLSLKEIFKFIFSFCLFYSLLALVKPKHRY